MIPDRDDLAAYTEHLRLQNKSFPDEWISYLIEGIVHQFNEHRDLFVEGAMWIQHMQKRHGYSFRLEYDPKIKTADDQEMDVDLLCQFDPNERRDDGGVWDIWVTWNRNVPDPNLEAVKVSFKDLKDSNFRFSVKNLCNFWMP